MSYEELEQRVQSLTDQLERFSQAMREEIAQLKNQVQANGEGGTQPVEPSARRTSVEEGIEPDEDDFIPAAEYDFISSVPAKVVGQVNLRIVSVERDTSGLSLSEKEWESLKQMVEDEDDERGVV